MTLDGGGRDGRSVGTDGAGPLLESARDTLAGFERELWVIALVALVGDLLLTYYGLEQGLTEANPVARHAVTEYGYLALGALKAGALGVGVAGWVVLPRRFGAIVPLALAIPWTVAVVVNVVMLAALP